MTNLNKYISKGSAKQDSKGLIELNMKTCIGCTMCASMCPYDNFSMETIEIDGKITIKAIVKNEYYCNICNICDKSCPTASIKINKKNDL